MELKQGDLENLILNAVWTLEEAGLENIDVNTVQNRINSEKNKWAYTTVKTVLDRLVDKAVLVRLKHGDSKKYFYKSVVSRMEASHSAINKLVSQYFYGDYTKLITSVKEIVRKDQNLNKSSKGKMLLGV